MDLWNTPAPDRRITTRLLNGDQENISSDTSIFREGSAWQIPTNSQLGTLVGGQFVMKYWTHNTAISEAGTFMPRDDAGACVMWCYCEDEIMRWYGAPSAAKGTVPVWTLYTSYNNLTGAWTPSQTGGIVGTTTNNSANAGSVGEYLTATIASGSAVSLTTATAATVTSVSLTAGDWDVWGVVDYTPAASTSITQLTQGINTTAATLGGQDTFSQDVTAAQVPTAVQIAKNAPVQRILLSGTTTVYLVARAAFTVSTLAAYGSIFARRVR